MAQWSQHLSECRLSRAPRSSFLRATIDRRRGAAVLGAARSDGFLGKETRADKHVRTRIWIAKCPKPFRSDSTFRVLDGDFANTPKSKSKTDLGLTDGLGGTFWAGLARVVCLTTTLSSTHRRDGGKKTRRKNDVCVFLRGSSFSVTAGIALTDPFRFAPLSYGSLPLPFTPRYVTVGPSDDNSP